MRSDKEGSMEGDIWRGGNSDRSPWRFPGAFNKGVFEKRRSPPLIHRIRGTGG
jgi:hypothetical protein